MYDGLLGGVEFGGGEVVEIVVDEVEDGEG